MKPRKGQTITRTPDGAAALGLQWTSEPVGVVIRADNSVCVIEHPDGTIDRFIWRFRDGLNTHFDWPAKNVRADGDAESPDTE